MQDIFHVKNDKYIFYVNGKWFFLYFYTENLKVHMEIVKRLCYNFLCVGFWRVLAEK